jgi:hypothetical protein
MTKDEALKLAMDWYGSGNQDPDEFERLILSIVAQPAQDGECKYCTDGCPACDARKLPEQEPVAWISPKELLVMRGNAYAGAKNWRVNLGLEPEEGDVGLYATPPQRTWVGLTEDEILLISADCAATHQHTDIHFAKAIEAKLRSKNS